MKSTDFDMLSLLRGFNDGQVRYRVNTLPDGSTHVEVSVGDPSAELDPLHADRHHDAEAEAAA